MSIISFGQPMIINHIISNEFTSNNSNFNLGGPEINTLVFLSNLGKKCSLISGFPNNEIGTEFKKYLIKKNINIDNILDLQKETIGLILLKKYNIFYQIENSAFTSLKESKINIKDIFYKKIDWLHLNCISISLTKDIDNIIINLINNSIEKDIKISIDLSCILSHEILAKVWLFLKKFIDRIFLFYINKTNLLSILEFEQIEESNCLEKSLLIFSNKFKIKNVSMTIVNSLDGVFLKKKEYSRFSILINEGKIYKSLIRKYKPIITLSENDYFLSSLINEFIDNKTFISDMLDIADFYTIQYMNSRYKNKTRNR